MKGNLFIISGPAGAGKSEIVKTLLKRHPEIGISISRTTRSPRAGEQDGRDYFFVTDEEFTRGIENGDFYEWAFVHQNRYGTPRSYVQGELEKGRDMILEIDVQGCMNVFKMDPDATGIFICPPSGENLEKRLRGRNSESEESLRVRLGNAAKEVSQARNYQYIVINQDWNVVPDALDRAVEQVYSVILAKRCEVDRHLDFLDTLKKTLNKEE